MPRLDGGRTSEGSKQLTQSLMKRQTPEEKELESKRGELTALSEQLAEAELQLEELKVSLLRFQRRYFQEVGRKYVELDDIKAQIAEAIARNKPDDAEAKVKAKQARDQANAGSKEYESFEKQDKPSSDEKPPSDECKKLYRRIAAIIHPDKATDDTKRELGTRLMKELNDAYAKRDIARMERILAEWEESPEAICGEGTGAELVRIIRAIAQVRRRIADVERAVAETIAGELHSLMIAVHNADAEGRNILSEMAKRLDRQIAKATSELDSLRKAV